MASEEQVKLLDTDVEFAVPYADEDCHLRPILRHKPSSMSKTVSILRRHKRVCLLLAVSLGTLLLLLISLCLHQQLSSVYRYASSSYHNLTSSWEFAEEVEYFQNPIQDPSRGHWIPSEVRRKDANLWNQQSSCQFDTSMGNYTDDEAAALTKQRNSDVAAWEWIPDDGSKLIEWNATQVLRRALESRVGIVSVGDSITMQSTAALELLLHPDSIHGSALIQNPIFADESGRINYTVHTLYSGHPVYNYLIETMPHIPRKRFDEPILWAYNSYHLVDSEELQEIMFSDQVGMTEPLAPQFRLSSSWVQALEDMGNLPGWDGEKPAIVQISTGAHYNQQRLFPAEEAHAIAGFRVVIDRVHEKLTHLPTTIPWRIFFRAVSPAHDSCSTISSPVSRADPVAETPSKNATIFGWHLFARHNLYARQVFDKPLPGQHNMLKFRFMDTWDMSVQRPDAHHGWQARYNYRDCLHWCQPSVPQWWIRLLWHHIAIDQ